MDTLRLPFFVVAAFLLVMAVGVEFASLAVIPSERNGPPGWGIPYLAIVDLLLAYGVGVHSVGLGKQPGLQGRLQGPISLVVSVFGLLGAVALAFLAFGLLMLMVGLMVAVPFGTLAYMALWSSFPETEARVLLGLIMGLKIGFCVLLLLAHQGFLKNKGLMILVGVSLGLTWLTGFLHALPPGPLVSITDVVAALVTAIVGAIWLLALLLGSVGAILASLRSVRVD